MVSHAEGVIRRVLNAWRLVAGFGGVREVVVNSGGRCKARSLG